MDTVTHALIGRLGGRALLRENESKRGLVNWMTGLGALPDIDALWSGTGGFGYLVSHRAITHSFLGIAVMALPIAWLMNRTVRGNPPLINCWLLAVATMLGAHVFYDVVTSFGTQVFVPFSRTRPALDWQFIIDPFFTGIIVAGLVAYRFRKGLAPVFFTGMLAYTGTLGLLHAKARSEVRAAASEIGPVEKASALPVPFSPFHWKGIAVLPDRLVAVPVDLVNKNEGTVREYARVDNSSAPEWEALWGHEKGKTYRWFARYLTGGERTLADGKRELYAYDLRFQTDTDNLGWMAGFIFNLLEKRDPGYELPVPFRIDAIVDTEGRVESIEMLRRTRR